MTTTTLTRNGTDGRVYGGDPGLVHIQDGSRIAVGARIAQLADEVIRNRAVADGLRTEEEALTQALCPGCFMVAIFNAALALAVRNGQPLAELGRSLAGAFASLAERAEGGETAEALGLEEIIVLLDPPCPLEYAG